MSELLDQLSDKKSDADMREDSEIFAGERSQCCFSEQEDEEKDLDSTFNFSAKNEGQELDSFDSNLDVSDFEDLLPVK